MDKKINADLTTEESYENRTTVEMLRGEDTRITGYKYNIYIHNKPTLTGVLTREEVEKIYQMYSSEGANLTQRTVAREFSNYTFSDFKRIMKALNITKASAPLAPHIIEEKTQDELVTISYQIKENSFLKRIEQERTKQLEKQLKDTTKNYYDLKAKFENLGSAINLAEAPEPYVPESRHIVSTKDLILHLSDLHIGAKVSRDSLYSNEYNGEVVKSRLRSVLDRLKRKSFDTIVINLLGDNIDGINQTTARPGSTHVLPQNMDNYEQVKTYLEIMEWFVTSIHRMNICNHIKIYSVKCGNHDGIVSWVATTALFSKLKLILPQIEYKIFDEFFGNYELRGHKFVITHGKDDLFMKHGLGLNLAPKEKIQIYNWLESKGIYGSNIHVIKGDLHSDNLNSCKKMDYRNCLSLFGASDHSNFNYELNDYGVSYEIIDDGELLRGTFINL